MNLQLFRPITHQRPFILEKDTTAPVYIIPNYNNKRILESLESTGEMGFTRKKKGSRKITDRPKVRTSGCAYKIFRHYWDPHKIDYIEEFKVLYLSRRKHALQLLPIAQGGITGTIADLRLVIAGALKVKASYIILAHNHPSGGLKPSHADNEHTKKITDAARLFNIEIVDHIIITSDGFYSFNDRASQIITERAMEKGEFAPKKINNIEEIDLIYKKKVNIRITDRPQIKKSEHIHQLCIEYWSPYKINIVEENKVLFLNCENRVMQILPLPGNSMAVHHTAQKTIIAQALKIAATQIVFVHNRPSNNLSPTRADEKTGQLLKEAAKLFHISLLDYITISSSKYFSLADAGIL